jgi:GNAT superfamily N-acetyltransferase
MKDLLIEEARLADREAVVSLLAGQITEHRMTTGEENLGRVVDQVLGNEQRGYILVARLGYEIVGVAYVAIILSVEHGAQVGWLEELYVRPQERGKGIGSALLNGVINTAQKRGLGALDLEVDSEHQRVESLYVRFGFRQLPRSRWVKDRL